jgi:hypothetical protein
LGVPDNLEPCVERRYFAQIHYLGLYCDDQELAQRLAARPDWRGSSAPEYINEHLRFNRWFQQAERQHPNLSRLDTTHTSLDQTVEQVKAWFNTRDWKPNTS